MIIYLFIYLTKQSAYLICGEHIRSESNKHTPPTFGSGGGGGGGGGVWGAEV